MTLCNRPIRVLYSFPNKLGGARICYTAWQQVNGLDANGAHVLLFPASICRAVPDGVSCHPTLARGNMRVPFRLLGLRNAMALHDSIVARRLERLRDRVDIVHTWPSGALRTLHVAARLGIPTVLERCSTHTRYAYEAVEQEARNLGISLRKGEDGAFDERVLKLEEEEFRLADRLLCPSDFVVKTFLDRGFSKDRLPRHFYGFDENTYYSNPNYRPNTRGLRVLFVGYCNVGKGVHYALDAWLRSPASQNGIFTIVGDFASSYRRKLAKLLSHPSIRVVGHKDNVAEFMRNNDALVLPSVQEGSALVCTEAMATGCVPIVSDVCSSMCKHMENALVHHARDVEALCHHITLLSEDRTLLQRLRTNGLKTRTDSTWSAAGIRLLDVYRETIKLYKTGQLAIPA